ncbi:hypothetical protein F4780DRAFT_791351 [Xylariomycetidae sp. FL0641]|nr:hypothetical protein F4780DRAFT_791351 [Xylariomycetidae sp. FL0641]
MAVLNQAFIDGAQAVARAVEVHVRQAATTAVTSAMSSATSATSPPPSTSPSSMTSATSASQTMPSPSATGAADDTQGNGGGGGGGGGGSGTSSPLLFFVALGFGVVFTNLWIIVGVKYCFRYNARNRQMRGLDENGEPINLENMPTRPHRRRREKKLMTMDEVNDKFPMMKYKTWVSERAREGLPTTGGVSAPPSRANSMRSVDGIVPEVPSKERDSVDNTQPNPTATPNSEATSETERKRTENGTIDDRTSTGTDTINESTNDTALAQAETVQTVNSAITKERRTSMDDEDDDEHIDAALPPELLGTAGDTCAICIDTLEDDDDVRGLTCGHAFHAVCLDPWLTNRRACCPLCKADYYTPKPRQQPADGDPNNPNSPTDPSRNNHRMNMPRPPQRSFTWSSFREAPRMMFFGRFGGGGDQAAQRRQPQRRDRHRSQRPQRPHRRPPVTQVQAPAPAPAPVEGEGGNWMSRFRGQLPPFRMGLMQRNRAQQAPGPPGSTGNDDALPAATTPSQLEAGVRPPATSN